MVFVGIVKRSIVDTSLIATSGDIRMIFGKHQELPLRAERTCLIDLAIA
jgi:hypothetical protein